jgi:translation elongation factor EF-Tu-like GTPase
MNRPHDIEAEFCLLPTAQGGRKTPAFSGYRPQHKIHENYQTSGQHEYLTATNQITPGETVLTKIWFVTPDVYPYSIWVGREIEVFEGSHMVGTLTVTRVVNAILIGSPENYNSVWVEPVGLDAQGRKIVG